MRSGLPVGKIARRLQIGPTLKTLKVLQRRENPPGVHGKRRHGAQSVFAQQLIEKQKLKFQFMISEKVLRRAYEAASKKKGGTGDNLVQLLDTRLDATIFRSGVVRSVLAARQLITHRHVFVNGKRVDRPSYQIGEQDVITFSEKALKFTHVTEGVRDANSVAYVTVDKDNVMIKRSFTPPRSDIPVICNEQMVVEWYSR